MSGAFSDIKSPVDGVYTVDCLGCGILYQTKDPNASYYCPKHELKQKIIDAREDK